MFRILPALEYFDVLTTLTMTYSNNLNNEYFVLLFIFMMFLHYKEMFYQVTGCCFEIFHQILLPAKTDTDMFVKKIYKSHYNFLYINKQIVKP